MIIRSVFVFAVLVAGVSAEERQKRELATLQGTWQLESLEHGGEKAELQNLRPRWVIKDDKLLYAGEPLATLSVNVSATPHTMDLTMAKAKKVCEAIWSVKDDTLKLCVNRNPDGVKERPGAFTTEDKPDFRLMVFKRIKADADPTAGLPGFVGIAIRLEDSTKEVMVIESFAGSPAHKAGLKKDDVVLKVAGVEVTDLKMTVLAIRQAKPGASLALRIRRDGKEQDVTVKVGVMPDQLLN